MKRHIIFLAALMLVSLLAGCATAPEKNPSAQSSAVQTEVTGAQTPVRTLSTEDAKACIVLDEEKSQIRWNQQTMLVGLKLNYINTCERPVYCSVRVETGSIESGRDTKLFKDWKMGERQDIAFDLPSGKTVLLEGGISWSSPKGRTPLIRFPRPPEHAMDYLQCNFK